ncbi:hypothetical protein ACFL3B_03520 [Gemmatimonadota bacterium]
MSTVAILSPGYPDSPGGVTDHTARLVKSWTGFGATSFVFGDVTEPFASLWERIETERTDSLLIQYVPFLYGRRGLSTLPGRLAASCQALGIRVSTFVHEPWVPPTRLPWLILSPLQKRQLKRVLALSDATVTAVPAWAKELGHSTQTVYVGSTLGDPTEPINPETLLTSPVVFSPFASGLRWDWIAAAVDSLGAGLVVVGSDHKTVSEHPIVGRYASDAWDCRGRVSAENALNLLARARLVLAPFVDGLTGRRTSAMASLSCGSQVLTSKGHLSDPAFAEGPAVVTESKEQFSRTARTIWEAEDTTSDREQRLSWYHDHCSATKLDDRLLKIVDGRRGD